MKKMVTLHPSRIGCPSVSGTMKGMILSISGVFEVKVRYKERSLNIVFDDAVTSVNAIVQKIGEETGLAMEECEVGAKKDDDVSQLCPK